MFQISIIIPVYNVESYIKDCLLSILDQKYNDCEIILVDDGSTDNSGNICDQFAEKYSNISVYHQQNKGQSSARNFGVSVAKGEYIWFVDSDDILLGKNFMMKLSDGIQKKPDIIAFGWKEIFAANGFLEGEERFNFKPEIELIQSGQDFLKKSLKQNKFYYWYPCIYLFNSEYWKKHNFQFIEGKKFEDFYLIYRVVIEADSVVTINEAIYGYRIGRPCSTTSSTKLEYLLQAIDIAADNIQDTLKNPLVDETLKRQLANNFACNYLAFIISSTKLSKSEQKIFLQKAREKSWILDYADGNKEKMLRVISKVFGIGVMQRILGIRRKIKYG